MLSKPFCRTLPFLRKTSILALRRTSNHRVSHDILHIPFSIHGIKGDPQSFKCNYIPRIVHKQLFETEKKREGNEGGR